MPLPARSSKREDDLHVSGPFDECRVHVESSCTQDTHIWRGEEYFT